VVPFGVTYIVDLKFQTQC